MHLSALGHGKLLDHELDFGHSYLSDRIGSLETFLSRGKEMKNAITDVDTDIKIWCAN